MAFLSKVHSWYQREVSQVLLLSGLAFVIFFGYALARPATESLFLAAYTASELPAAWILGSVGVFVTVMVYTKLAAHLSLQRLFQWMLVASGLVLVGLLVWTHPAIRGAAALQRGPFLLYLWKDIYIVVLSELFWSCAALLSVHSQARYTYALYCLCGSCGSILGNLLSSALAERLGTLFVLGLTLPALVVTMGLVWVLSKNATALQQPPGEPSAKQPSHGGFAILFRSRYLVPLFFLIGVVQVGLTLIDYQFNQAIRDAYPEMDRRTVLIGQVYAAIDGLSLGLQLATGMLLRVFGMGRVLLFVPLVLGLSVLLGGLRVVSSLFAAAMNKLLGKALDYSLLRAAKELLYLPLSYEEKTAGKALIDMMVYRAAKGGAAALLALFSLGLFVLPWVILGLIGTWFALTVVILRRYRRLEGGSGMGSSESAARPTPGRAKASS